MMDQRRPGRATGRRRVVLGGAACIGAGALLPGCGRRFFNPCESASDESHRVDAEFSLEAWRDLDAPQVWDCHVHLAGIGPSPSETQPWTNPRMRSPANLFLFAHFALYADASCVLEHPGDANDAYVRRLRRLAREFPGGVKFLLYAMDGCVHADGRFDAERSVMWVPNEHVRRIAAQDPQRFEWVASINPLRPDALERLSTAAAQGAVALKWVPYFMDIDPSDARHDGFYDLLARLKLPLIVHGGWQHELVPGSAQEHGNPLRMRRALERGVRVVMAHCATQGDFDDIDHGRGATQRPSFELLARLMEEPAHRALLLGEISGIIDNGRPAGIVQDLLTHPRWEGRLVNGSDYPLPGVPLVVSSDHLMRGGLLAERVVPLIDHVQAHNPLLFDFLLKRSLAWRGRRFAPAVFETARHFRRPVGGGAASAAEPTRR